MPHPVINLGFVRIDVGPEPAASTGTCCSCSSRSSCSLFYRLEDSRLGRAWAAIREDEVAAQATGVNTTRVKLLAFAIGASTSGAGRRVLRQPDRLLQPATNFILNNSILVVAYVVFGGMGSLPGAIAGAAVLTWLPEFLQGPGAGRGPADVDRRRRADHDDLPAGRA